LAQTAPGVLKNCAAYSGRKASIGKMGWQFYLRAPQSFCIFHKDLALNMIGMGQIPQIPQMSK
jgi:hypothetical protein